MAQLLVRNLDPALIVSLRRRALEHGVSAEEEHRRILSEALDAVSEPKPSLMEFLLKEGEPWPQDLIPPRSRDTNEHRRVEF